MRITDSGRAERNAFHRRVVQRQPLNRQTAQMAPPRYKLFLLTWLGIYPLITVIFLLFGSWLGALPLLLRTLLLTAVAVYLMTYVVMPRLTRVFHRWLYIGK